MLQARLRLHVGQITGDVELAAVPPTLAVRDRLRDAKADQILVRNGAMSAEVMALRHGLESSV